MDESQIGFSNQQKTSMLAFNSYSLYNLQDAFCAVALEEASLFVFNKLLYDFIF